jgi:hypothetical protein
MRHSAERAGNPENIQRDACAFIPEIIRKEFHQNIIRIEFNCQDGKEQKRRE